MTSDMQVRCPVGAQRLFMILRQKGERPKVTEDNLMEFACHDCARTQREQGNAVYRVYHRYNFIGELIETENVYKEESGGLSDN